MIGGPANCVQFAGAPIPDLSNAPKGQRQIQDFFFPVLFLKEKGRIFPDSRFLLVPSGHRSLIGARKEPLFPPISILFPLPKEEEKIRLFSDISPDSERSRRKSVLFLSEKGPVKKDLRLPSKIASDFRRQAPGPLRFRRNRRRRRKSEKNPFFSPSHFMARQKNLSHRWLGKKILPFFPIPLESEERPFPQIPLESEGTRSRGKYRKKDRRFFFRCPPKIHRIFGRPDLCRRKSQALFDGRGASPPIPKESEGTRRLPSKIACDFRRQARALFPIFSPRVFFEFGRLAFPEEISEKSIEIGGNGFSPILKKLEETLVSRRKSQAIFYGRR